MPEQLRSLAKKAQANSVARVISAAGSAGV